MPALRIQWLHICKSCLLQCLHQGQQGHKDNFDLQISQPRMENRVPDSAMRCLSGLVQPSLNESLNMPCSLLPAGTLATTTEQCLEAAALAAAAWPSGGLPLPAAG